MPDELDFLSEDANNPSVNTQEPTVEQIAEIAPQPEQAQFVAPSWEDVKSGRIKYQDLPPNIKSKVKREAYEQTPDDKKYLWDEYKYTPPETYGGVDRNGRKVDALDLDGFEELVKSGRIKPKTKVEQDVEDLKNIVKDNTKIILSQKESEIERKISEAKENVDFEAYEKLLSEKQDVTFQKLQLNKKEEVAQPVKQDTDVSNQFSLDEQVAFEIFASDPDNKGFIDLMAKSKDMQDEFDRVAYTLKVRNQNATLDQIGAAAKKIVETKFNLNKQQSKPMSRNFFQQEQKTTMDSGKQTQTLTYNSLTPRDRKWIDSEAKSGRQVYSGKTLDQITNMVFGKLIKK